MEIKTFKIWGIEGHLQRESFSTSENFNFSNGKIETFCSDITGTNDYVLVRITKNTENKVLIDRQLLDGIGKIEELLDIGKDLKYSKIEELDYEGQQILNAIEDYIKANDYALNAIENC